MVGEDLGFGAVAVEGGLVVAEEDGEDVEDVGGVGAGDTALTAGPARWGVGQEQFVWIRTASPFDAFACSACAGARIRVLLALSCPPADAGRALGRGV